MYISIDIYIENAFLDIMSENKNETSESISMNVDDDDMISPIKNNNIDSIILDTNNLDRLVSEYLTSKGYHELSKNFENKLKNSNDNDSPNCNNNSTLYNIINKAKDIINESHNISKISNNNNDSDNENENDTELIKKSKINWGKYNVVYAQTHKSKIKTMNFSNNGQYFGIGNDRGNLKIYDVNKIYQVGITKKFDKKVYQKPIIAGINNNNNDIINDLSFHPHTNITKHIVGCTQNGYLLYYEFGNINQHINSKLLYHIRENFGINTIEYHPKGEYILYAGSGNHIRLFNFIKNQGYIFKPKNNNEYNLLNKEDSINCIKWSNNGNIFVSCNKYGYIKLYDGRILKCVNTIKNGHNGKNIISLRFNKNSKYLLSNGFDNIIKLWDLRNGKTSMEYRGCDSYNKINKNYLKMPGLLSHNDEHIIGYNYDTNKINVYDTNTGKKIYKINKEFRSNYLTSLEISPTNASFVIATNDNRLKFFNITQESIQSKNKLSNNTSFGVNLSL